MENAFKTIPDENKNLSANVYFGQARALSVPRTRFLRENAPSSYLGPSEPGNRGGFDRPSEFYRSINPISAGNSISPSWILVLPTALFQSLDLRIRDHVIISAGTL